MCPDKKTFKRIILDFFNENKRDLPWRGTADPYEILVSEIMLQQTQVSRVLGKYGEFLKEFPNFEALGEAAVNRVLAAWQGLGYNRRALALKKTAEKVISDFNGRLPSDTDALETLPGIGRNTAGSIAAFAFNRPSIFIETNIRSVFLHFFFQGRDNVPDSEILPLVGEYLDRENPRRWYNALMDYGVMLKAANANPNVRSSGYVRQKPFRGSERELRGKIVGSAALAKGPLPIPELAVLLEFDEGRVLAAAEKLSKEGFFTIRDGKIIIS